MAFVLYSDPNLFAGGLQGVYATLEDAVAAAAPGNAIFIQAGSTIPASFTVTKDNLFFGAANGAALNLIAGTGVTTLTVIDNGADMPGLALTGNSGDNVLTGNSGGNSFTGGAGNDTINGGAGSDTATYTSNWVGATVTNGGNTVQSAADGTDTLTGVETLVFNGVSVSAAAAVNDAPDVYGEEKLGATAAGTSLNGAAIDAVGVGVSAAQGVLANDTDADLGLGLGETLAVNGVGTGGTFNGTIGGWTSGTYGQLRLQADGSYVYSPYPNNNLAEGQRVSDTFNYRVVDAHGATGTAELTVYVDGLNDAPTYSNLAGNVSADVLEHPDAGAQDIGLSGGFMVTDVDSTDTLSISVGTVATSGSWAGAIPAGLTSAFSATLNGSATANTNGSGISVNWSFDPAALDLDFLPEGATIVLTFPVTVTDSHSATTPVQDVTITITGTNDMPALTGVQTALAAGTEDNSYVISKAQLLEGWTDRDAGTLLDVVGIAADHASVTDNGNGTFTLAPTANFNGVLTLGYAVTDGVTIVPTSRTVTIDAVNDMPTLAPVTAGSIAENFRSTSRTELNLSGTLNGADVDIANEGDTISYGIDGGTPFGGTMIVKDGAYGQLQVDSASGAYNYIPNAAAIEALAQGENPSDSFTVSVTDSHGASATQTYAVQLTGGNDVPTSAGSITASHGEDESSFVVNLLDGVSDVDHGATFFVSPSVFSMTGDTAGATAIGSNLSINTAAYQYLSTGQNAVINVSYEVLDEHGAYVARSATITVAGANEVVAGNGTLTGGAFVDEITGGSGDDDITGNGGNDLIQGGDGQDTAHYGVDLTPADFSYDAGTNTWTVNAGAEGIDSLVHMEKVVDGTGQTFLLVDLLGSYTTIQSAIDAASAGDTILVAAGTYVENVNVNKAVTLVGANAGIGGAGARGAESVIQGPVNVTAAATLDGFEFLNANAAPAGFVGLQVHGAVDVTVTNSRFYSAVANGNDGDRALLLDTTAVGNITISNNYFGGAAAAKYSTASWQRGIWSDGSAAHLAITGNTFEYMRTALNLDSYNDATHVVSGNSFLSSGTGIALGIPVTNTITGIHDNSFNSVDADFNMRNVTTGESFDLGATNNVGSGAGADAQLYVLGTAGSDTLSGTAGSDILDARDSAGSLTDTTPNYLAGKGGADILIGSLGNDTLDGGSGDDQISGGAGRDVMVLSGSFAAYNFSGVTISGGVVGGTVSGSDGTDTVSGIEVLKIGGAFHVLAGMSIQAAINAAVPGETIVVHAGTFTEQLLVDGKDGLTIEAYSDGITTDTVTVKAPAVVAVNGVSGHWGDNVRAVIAVKDSDSVTIKDLKVDGSFAGDTTPGSNGDELTGIAYLSASGSIDHVTVQNVSNNPAGGLFGLQHGSGLLIDGEDNNPLTALPAVSVTDSTINGFQKTGVLVWGADLTFENNTVTGIGATALTAQNPMQIGGSQGTIDGNTFEGFAYTGGTWSSTGIIVYEPTAALGITNNAIEGAGAGSVGVDLSDTGGHLVTVSGNSFDNLDYGVYAYTYTGGALGLDAASITGNSFTDILIEGIHFNPEESYGSPFTTAAGFTVDGTPFDDQFNGGDGADTFHGLGGSDVLQGNGGSDTLDGGLGHDTAIYSGNYADATVTVTIDPVTGFVTGFTAVSTAGDGSDTLSGIEKLQFDDMTVDLGEPVQLLDPSNHLLGTFTTIQAAIDAASDGDTVMIGAGSYSEEVLVNKSLTLVGANGGIDATGSRGPESVLDGGFEITANDVTIDGMTVLHGRTDYGVQRSAFYVDGAWDNVTITNNIADLDGASGPESSVFGVVTTYGSDIDNLQISHNLFTGWDSGMYLNPGLQGSSISSNHFEANGNHIIVDDPDSLTIADNVFGTSGGSQIAVGAMDPTVDMAAELGLSGNVFNSSTSHVSAFPYGGDGQSILGTSEDDRFYGIYGSPIDADRTYDGRGGDDRMLGGDGDETFVGGAGNDYIEGGAGRDVLVLSGNFASYAASLAGATVAGGELSGTITGADGTDTVSGIEVLKIGGAFHVLAGMSIQAAVDAAAPGDMIVVHAGTYAEQVVIDGKDGLSIWAYTDGFSTDAVTIVAPADVVQTALSTTGRALNAVVTVTNATGVELHSFTVDGAGHANTVDGPNANFVGVVYRNASGGLEEVNVTGIRDPYPGGNTVGGEPVVSGNQRGVGVQVDNDGPAKLDFSMHGGQITDFQKNATVFNNANLDVSLVTIIGGGAQPINAQNGFQVLNSTGAIHNNTITDIGYAGSQVVYSGAILAYGNTDLDIIGNTIVGANVDSTDAKVVGIYVFDNGPDNSGGSITDNIISFVDEGIDVSGTIAPDGIAIGPNTITNIDLTDPYAGGVYFAPDGAVPTAYIVSGSDFDDYLQGGSAGDTLSGLGGNDTLIGNGGNDTLDGGLGTDTAVYSGTFAAATVTVDTDPVSGFATSFSGVTTAADGTDGLSGVEKLVFSDATLDLTDPVQLFDATNHLLGTFDHIQDAIDAATTGGKILVSAGTYAEHLTVDVDNLTIKAIGSVVLDGSFFEDNGIATGASLAAWFKTHASYSGLAGDGVTVSADGLTLDGLTITQFRQGIVLSDGTSGTTLDDVTLTANFTGINKPASAVVTGFTMSGGAIGDGHIGFDIPQASGGAFDTVLIDGVLFEHLNRKGIYAEALSNAQLLNLTMNDVGKFGGITATSSLGAGGNGINLNLKYGTYGNIVIDGFTFTDVGQSNQDGAAASHKNGGAIVVEARNDGGYAGTPASLTDPVIVRNGTIDGTSTGIHLGEPDKANPGDVIVENVAITNAVHNADHGDIANEGIGTLTFTGTPGADSLIASTDTDGALVIDGGAGADTVKGGSADDTVTGGAGSDSVDGLAGDDVLVIAGDRADSTIVKNANGSYSVVDNGNADSDTLVHVEGVRFNDGITYELDANSPDFASAFLRFSTGFEDDVSAFIPYDSTVTQEASGSNGVASASGAFHARISHSDEGGAFTRFDGYRSDDSQGLKTTVAVYLDVNMAAGEGFDYSVAANNQSGAHLRDFVFHVTKDTSTGQLLIGAGNGSTFDPIENLETANHVVIDQSGWYTFEHKFYENADGKLEVAMNVYDSAGNWLFTEVTSSPSDDFATDFGGNRYGWFTNVDVTGGIAVDSVSLSTLDSQPVQLIDDTTHVILGTFLTIQEAVDAAGAVAGAVTILVSDGDYHENVVIDRGDLTLRSVNGRGTTTITGNGAGSELGTIEIDPSVNNVTIGGAGHGFTIVGINGNGAVEKGAIYLQGGHDGLNVLGNNVVANGDAGLMSEFGGAITNMLIDGNEFSGQTFTGAQPGGTGFGQQFNVGNNVPRQLVVLGNGNNAQLSNHIVFSNNLVSGTAGGISVDTGLPLGNSLVTIDAKDSEISGNSFTGYTDGAGYAIRARAEHTDVTDNTLDDGAGQSRGIFVANQGVPGTYSGNAFVGGADADTVVSMTAGDDTLTGNGGDDVLVGNGGNDTIDGGGNNDTAGYSGAWRDYNVTPDGLGGFTIVDGRAGSPDGTDAVTNVENFRFSNVTATAAQLPNDAPIGVDDSAAAGNALANDTDADSTLGDTKAVTGIRTGTELAGGALTSVNGADVVIAGTYGDLTIRGDGTYSYAINPSYAAYIHLADGAPATDSFTYQVSDYHGLTDLAQIDVTIAGGNEEPVAIDDSASTDENVTLVVGPANGVLANDTDADTGDTLVVTSVNNDAGAVGNALAGDYGSLTLNADGSYTYVTNDRLPEGVHGTDTFVYTVSDSKGGSDAYKIVFDDYDLGPIADGEHGWQLTGPGYDQEVVANSGGQGWQFTRQTTSGSFGDQPFTPALGQTAGEEGATGSFSASWTMTPQALEPGAAGSYLGVSMDDGTGARGNLLRLESDADGQWHLYAFDYSHDLDDFVAIDLGILPVGEATKIGFTQTFVPGAGNDVWTIYVNDEVVGIGQGWEDYFRDYQSSVSPVTYDRLLFRASGSAVAGDHGVVIDDVSVSTDQFATLTIDVTGVNDAPVVSGAVLAAATEDGAIIGINALAHATDADNDALFVVDPATLPAGVTSVHHELRIGFETSEGYVAAPIAGQQGWTDASPSSPAGGVVDLGGNQVYLVANDPSSGDFGGPYSPSLSVAAGAPGDTGAAVDQFEYSFLIKPVGEVADGSRIEVDMANAAGTDRFNFMALEYGVGGVRLVQNSPFTPANWQSNDFDFGTGNVTLALLDPSVWHEIKVVATLSDGANNDQLDYYVDGVHVGSGSSFEGYGSLYTVDKILFRAGEPAGNPYPQDGAGPNRAGFYIDNLAYQTTDSTGHYQFDPSDAAYQYLAAGETTDVTINYEVSDGVTTTPTSAVITVTGTNDAVSISSASGTGSVTEDMATPTLTAIGVISFDDIDLADTHSVSVADGVGNTLGGVLSANVAIDATGPGAGTVSWTYNVDNADTQYLAVGETVVETFTITIDDGEGSTIDQLVTITVTGTNDAPVITIVGPDAAGATRTETNAGLVADGTLTVTDVDLLDTVSSSVTSVVASGFTNGLVPDNAALLAMLSLSPTSPLAAEPTDQHNLGWTFNSGSEAFNNLPAGQQMVLTYTVSIDDGHGGTDTQDVTITINGTNDVATVTSNERGNVSEDGATGGNGIGYLTDAGHVTVSDADYGEAAAPFTNYTVGGNYGVFHISPNGDWTYFLNSNNMPGVQHLGVGETFTDAGSVLTADGSVTVYLSVDIHGTNDDPTISGGPSTASYNEPVDFYPHAIDVPALTGSLTVADFDTHDLVTGAATGAATILINGAAPSGAAAVAAANLLSGAGLLSFSTVNPNGGSTTLGWTYDPGNVDLDFLNPGDTLTVTYHVQAQDNHGGVSGSTQDVVISIHGTAETLVGTPDDDTLNGSPYDDVITGLGADDIIDGKGGNDRVEGGEGDDVVRGGAGDDTIVEGAGSDSVTGGSGTDTVIYDGSWNDYLITKVGANYLVEDLRNGDVDTLSGVELIKFQGGADGPYTMEEAKDDAPVAVDDAAAGAAASGNVTSNDLYSEAPFTDSVSVSGIRTGLEGSGAALTAVPGSGTIVVSGAYGNLTIDATGAYSYAFTGAASALGAGEVRTDVFTYQLKDSKGLADLAQLTVTVTGSNDAPVLTGVQATLAAGTEDTAYAVSTASLLAGFTDADGDTLSIANLVANHGTVTVTPTGFLITPPANYNGPVGLSYNVVDGKGGVVAATQSFTLAPVNDAPVLVSPLADAAATQDVPFSYAVPVGTFTDVDGDMGPLTATLANGSPLPSWLSFDGTTFSGTPVNGDAGTLQVKVIASDGSASTYDVFQIVVGNTNDAPALTGSQATLAHGTEDVSYNVSKAALLAGFSDADGDALSVINVMADHGTVLVTSTGFQIVPAANYYGPINLIYEVVDGNGGSVAATQSYIVDPVNDAPLAGPTVLDQTAHVNSSFSFTLPAGTFTDVDGDVLTLTATRGGGAALPSWLHFDGATGTFTGTPGAGDVGGLRIRVTAADAGPTKATQIFYLTIDRAVVNSAPVAHADSLGTNEDTALTINPTALIANDTDGDGDSLTVTSVSAGVNGTVAIIAGNVVFTPTANYNGTGSFDYTVADGKGGTSTATVTVNIAAVNDAPTAPAAAIISVPEDTSGGNIRFVNASDVDGDVLTYALLSGYGPAHGTVTFNPAVDTLNYVPSPNYSGSDVFTILITDGHGGSTTETVTVNVTPVNDAPVAVDDNGLVASADQPTLINPAALLINDSDVDGDSLYVGSVASISGGHGTVTMVNGNIRFTPDAGYTGPASFSYTVSDGHGGTASAVAYVEVVPGPVNHAPALTGSQASLANGSEDNGYAVSTADLLAGYTDADSDTLAIANLTADHGTVVVTPTGFLITPPANYNGPVGLTYDVVDGHGGTTAATQSYVIDPVNDAPTAAASVNVATNEDFPLSNVAIGASDIEGDTLAYAVASGFEPAHGVVTFNQAGGTFTYTPDLNFNGGDSFTIEISDGNGGTTTQVVNVTVNPVNDAPTASSAIAITISEDTPSAAMDIFAQDVDGDTLSYSVASGFEPAHGTVTFDQLNGKVTYTPTANYNGSDSFRILISDGHGGTTTQDAYVTVQASNDAPTDLTFTGGSVAENSANGTLVATATAVDVDGPTAIYSLLDDAGGRFAINSSNGQITVANGTLLDYETTTSHNVTVQVDDGLGATYQEVLTIQVTNVAEGTGYEGSPYDDTASAPDANPWVANGYAGNDTLTGGAGADTLNGGENNDVLQGRGGADQINGGNGNDTASYLLSAATVNVNLLAHTASGGDAAGDVLTSIENLIGSAGADTLVGDNLDNILRGAAGADILTGNGGTDTADYTGSGSGVTINLGSVVGGVSTGVGGDAQGDQLSSIENIIGSSFVDKLTTATGGGNVLYGMGGDDTLTALGGVSTLDGGAGNDTLKSGSGNDIMRGGADNDTYIINAALDQVVEDYNQGTDTVQSSVTYTLTSNVENLTLTGSANLDGTGNELDNTIYGNSGANILRGGIGLDIMYGQGGADILIGGAGEDRMGGGTGADIFRFEALSDMSIDTTQLDQIKDFSTVEGDKIDLSMLDANTLLGGDQAFTFVGTNAFSHTAGELMYFAVPGNAIIVAGDVNGDGNADFMFRVGLTSINASDFML